MRILKEHNVHERYPSYGTSEFCKIPENSPMVPTTQIISLSRRKFKDKDLGEMSKAVDRWYRKQSAGPNNPQNNRFAKIDTNYRVEHDTVGSPAFTTETRI